jgi:tRNA G18 (ribose-2'-O)-methylase SpoU
MRSIVLIAHNLRSCHNVGSLLRTAEGLGVHKVILSGYTPYPRSDHDPRLPHEAKKIDAQIHKTALGAESLVDWEHADDIYPAIRALRAQNYHIYALEQTANAMSLPDFKPPEHLALVIGREVEGIEPEVLAACDGALEIPMLGQKESFNVVQAAAMALYHVTFR